jgi:hypothetical protein
MKKISILLLVLCATVITLGSAKVERSSTVTYQATYNPTPGCQNMFKTCLEGYLLGVVGAPAGLVPGQTYQITLQRRANPTICQHYNLVSIGTGLCP